MLLLRRRFVFGLKNHKVLRGQNVGPSKAAVQAGVEWNKAKKAEIREVDIEFRFWMALEKTPTDALVRVTLTIDAPGTASNSEARMGKGIAFAGLTEEIGRAHV